MLGVRWFSIPSYTKTCNNLSIAQGSTVIFDKMILKKLQKGFMISLQKLQKITISYLNLNPFHNSLTFIIVNLHKRVEGI